MLAVLFTTACGAGFVSPGCLSNLPQDVAGKGIACDAASPGGQPSPLLPVAVSSDRRTYATGTPIETNLGVAVTNVTGGACLMGGRCPPSLPVIEDVNRRIVWPPSDAIPDCTAGAVSVAAGQTKRYSFRVTGLRLAAGVYFVSGFISNTAYGRFYFAVC